MLLVNGAEKGADSASRLISAYECSCSVMFVSETMQCDITRNKNHMRTGQSFFLCMFTACNDCPLDWTLKGSVENKGLFLA